MLELYTAQGLDAAYDNNETSSSIFDRIVFSSQSMLDGLVNEQEARREF